MTSPGVGERERLDGRGEVERRGDEGRSGEEKRRGEKWRGEVGGVLHVHYTFCKRPEGSMRQAPDQDWEK